jgi:hypothetical protein
MTWYLVKYRDYFICTFEALYEDSEPVLQLELIDLHYSDGLRSKNREDASIQWVPGTLSPVVKRPEREADLSPPSSAKIKNEWKYSSTPS